ncbi:MAG: sigma-70 family RNA polymerase sigma factor [Piscinibacter sp.]|nr:sigma-70 family RNA polymerase sigma factor [Piscinibacter sp.]
MPTEPARRMRICTTPERDEANERLVELLGRVALRDRAAFRALYDATSAHLLGVAFSLLHHRERAEEVLQECYLSVWNAAGSYNAETARPMTWLINIVRNRSIDALRALRSRQDFNLPLDDTLAESVVDLAPRPEQQLQRALAERGIEAALTKLSRHERQAVAQVIYRGLTHAEIAARAQVPLSTAKTWVRRGLMRLKDHLEIAH